MPKRKPTLIKLLKEYTDIDHKFIDTFLAFYHIPKEDENYEFHILDDNVSNYLNIKVTTIRNRLQNKYTDKKVYYENVDYVRVYKDLPLGRGI